MSDTPTDAKLAAWVATQVCDWEAEFPAGVGLKWREKSKESQLSVDGWTEFYVLRIGFPLVQYRNYFDPVADANHHALAVAQIEDEMWEDLFDGLQLIGASEHVQAHLTAEGRRAFWLAARELHVS